MWGSGFSLLWGNFCGTIILPFVGHWPIRFEIWFYCNYTSPIVSCGFFVFRCNVCFWYVPPFCCWWLWFLAVFSVFVRDDGTSFYSAILPAFIIINLPFAYLIIFNSIPWTQTHTDTHRHTQTHTHTHTHTHFIYSVLYILTNVLIICQAFHQIQDIKKQPNLSQVSLIK